MKVTAIHGLGENMKMIVNESTIEGITVTYIGLAFLFDDNDNKNYKAVIDTAKPIWRIKKTIEDSNTGITETFYPVKDGKVSNKTEFVLDDALTYTYI